jgi:uncharacterized protein (DUF362 family)/ferredoxin-like protein FixX
MMEKLNGLMDDLGGWDRFVAPGNRVLLKVNLIGPKPPESAGLTHYEFVRALVRILRAKECEVWIGDSSGGAIAGIAPTTQAFQVSKLQQVAEEEGAIIKNFDKEGARAIQRASNPEETMYLANPMFEADVVINLPKLKTHSMGIYTGAVKNVFGCLPGLRKAKYHRDAPAPEDFGAILADIHQAVPIHLHIMDGIVAMQGEGPTAGDPYPAQKILASTDPMALDTVGMSLMGLRPKEIPILFKAMEAGIGISDLNEIEVVGDWSADELFDDFHLPKRYYTTKKQNYGSVIRVIDFLKTRPVINPGKCVNCNMCVESCPVEAIDRDTKKIDYHSCIECMCCHELCRYEAVELKRQNFLASIAMKFYRGRH